MTVNTVILVDGYDQEVGQVEKHHAHEHGLRHRAISVVVMRYDAFDGLETLLQKRHPSKYHAPDCWSNSCCSHPFPGESIKDAASRRLKEELGMTLPLVYLDRLDYRTAVSASMVEDELDHIFIAIDDGQAVKPHPKEVVTTRWVSLEELQQELKTKPTRFSPWFALVMDIVLRQKQKVMSLI